MKRHFFRTLLTIIVIIVMVSCITAVKLCAKDRRTTNILPTVDILVIEADTVQRYN